MQDEIQREFEIENGVQSASRGASKPSKVYGFDVL
jgi:hypothetical protein